MEIVGKRSYEFASFRKEIYEDELTAIAREKRLKKYDELIKNELNSFGFYLTYHPVSKYKDNIYTNTLSLEDSNNKYIELVLEVNNIKEVLTKKNDVMAFVKASDEYRQIDLTLFPNLYQENKNLTIYDIIKIYGKVEKRFDNYQIVVSKIINLTRGNYEK